jgi:hypothetical protein
MDPLSLCFFSAPYQAPFSLFLLLVVLAPGDFVSLISLSILSVFLACPCLYEVLLILLSLLCLARSKESLSLLYFWEYASKLPEELLPVTSQPVIGLLASFWGNDCWASYSADNLLGERVALQVHAGRVVPYVEPPIDKAYCAIATQISHLTSIYEGVRLELNTLVSHVSPNCQSKKTCRSQCDSLALGVRSFRIR